jgi:amidase
MGAVQQPEPHYDRATMTFPAADPLNAFIPHDKVHLAGAPSGPLKGLTFAAKDLYDIAGHVTGCGNPDWLASHGPATSTAPVVAALLAAGAELTGKTITDELAYSLNGQNFHYGTPINVNAPGRIPCGSSSGSAAAVAGKAVDLALGSDTGGSVRVPAAVCGIYGIRPTHGRVSLEGAMPLAPSFDTAGWFARDAGLLARIGEVLMGEDSASLQPGVARISDGFALAEPSVRAAVEPLARQVEALRGTKPAIEIGGLGDWMLTFRKLQAREIWQTHGAWIEKQHPRFGPEVAARFEWARSVASQPASDEVDRRRSFTARLAAILGSVGILIMPTAPDIAPLRGLEGANSQSFRDRTLSMTCIAGMARLPQVNVPAGRVNGCPVGLSLVGPQGSDRALLNLAAQLS